MRSSPTHSSGKVLLRFFCFVSFNHVQWETKTKLKSINLSDSYSGPALIGEKQHPDKFWYANDHNESMNIQISSWRNRGTCSNFFERNYFPLKRVDNTACCKKQQRRPHKLSARNRRRWCPTLQVNRSGLHFEQSCKLFAKNETGKLTVLMELWLALGATWIHACALSPLTVWWIKTLAYKLMLSRSHC